MQQLTQLPKRIPKVQSPQNTLYTGKFFDAIEPDSLASARAVIPLVRALIPFQSVVDVGCGRGAWLKVFQEYGATTIRGYDGDYVDRSKLLIPAHCFHAADLSVPAALTGDFDLAVCLEVAEHLGRKSAQPLVRSLCRLAPAVLFSAAIPGQGGTNHINEQWPHYWEGLFTKEDYIRLDPIRRHVVAHGGVATHYKQNTYLFVKRQLLELSGDLLAEKELSESMDVTIIASSRLVPLLSVQGRCGELLRGIVHSLRNRLGY